MPTTNDTVPGKAVRQTLSRNDCGFWACWSAVPYWVVGMGAGSVTGGAVMFPVPVNCVVMLVTTKVTPPVDVTVTRNGMMNGVATGHPNGGRPCVADETAWAVIATDERPPNGVFVGLAGTLELQEARSNAMPADSERAMSRDMGNLRPRQSKPPAMTPPHARYNPRHSQAQEGCL